MNFNILITSIGGLRGRDLALKLKKSLRNTSIYTGDQVFQENMNYFSDGFFLLKSTKNKKNYISLIGNIIKKKRLN